MKKVLFALLIALPLFLSGCSSSASLGDLLPKEIKGYAAGPGWPDISEASQKAVSQYEPIDSNLRDVVDYLSIQVGRYGNNKEAEDKRLEYFWSVDKNEIKEFTVKNKKVTYAFVYRPEIKNSRPILSYIWVDGDYRYYASLVLKEHEDISRIRDELETEGDRIVSSLIKE